MLAGLAGAPNRFSPFKSRVRARQRRASVLTAMVQTGAISETQAKAASDAPIETRNQEALFEVRTPYYAEHVRRYLQSNYGDKELWEGGLQVEGTLLPWMDASAQDNVDFGLRKLDKRQGWRGPVTHLTRKKPRRSSNGRRPGMVTALSKKGDVIWAWSKRWAPKARGFGSGRGLIVSRPKAFNGLIPSVSAMPETTEP